MPPREPAPRKALLLVRARPLAALVDRRLRLRGQPGRRPRRAAVRGALRRLPHARGGRHRRAARASGSAGPNLDYRRETKDQVLYAIRNGGFSGAIMPQNIVVGEGRRGRRGVRRQERRHQGQEPAVADRRTRTRRRSTRRHGRVRRQQVGRPTLDLKLIRSDPEGVKARARAAGRGRGDRRAAGARRAAPRAAAPGRGAPRAAEPGLRRDRAAKREGGDAARRWPSRRACASEIKQLEQELAAVEARDRGAARVAAEPSRPLGPGRRQRGGRRDRARGRRAARLRLRAARPPRARHRAGRDRHGERRARVRDRGSPT